MQIAVPRETHPDERRVALIPDSIKKLVQSGAEVLVEAGLGAESGFPDDEYAGAGAKITSDHNELLAAADLLVRVRKPSPDEIAFLKPGSIHVSYLDPYNEPDLIDKMAEQKVSAISMEMIPRTTRAQKMDVLSSQASLAGYVSVLLAASRLDSIFPMMMTPSGTISPARVFIIGVGVAGLQAIATAKRLGARVEAFDTRPVVAEQVRSLGAKFVDIDLGETGQTKDGYARELTDAQMELQRQGMQKAISQSDVVITTAQVFGRPAPRIVTHDMVASMKPGGVIVDMAVETGGNVAGSVVNEEVVVGGVTIVGLANLPASVCKNASQMYSANIYNLISEFWNDESKSLDLNQQDDIIQGCLITHDGKIVNESIKSLR